MSRTHVDATSACDKNDKKITECATAVLAGIIRRSKARIRWLMSKKIILLGKLFTFQHPPKVLIFRAILGVWISSIIENLEESSSFPLWHRYHRTQRPPGLTPSPSLEVMPGTKITTDRSTCVSFGGFFKKGICPINIHYIRYIYGVDY